MDFFADLDEDNFIQRFRWNKATCKKSISESK